MRLSWRFGTGHVESVEDYAGVLVPLEEAHLYSHSARTGRTEFETHEEGDDDDETGSAKDGDGERQGMLQMNAAEYTIEGLRKAMREGRRGNWTEYESKSWRATHSERRGSLTANSQIKTHQQGYTRHRHGLI